MRSVNPQTYTAYCVYSEEEVSDNNLAGNKRIITCSSLKCSYYQRMMGSGAGGAMGVATSAGSTFGVIWIGAGLMVPLTGGASLLVAEVVTVLSSVGVGLLGTVLTAEGMENTTRGIENELKLKWENEQKERKISDLQRQLANSKRSLAEAKGKKDEYKRKLGESSSNYHREKKK